MIEFYPQIRLVHIAAVAASGALFFMRGAAVQLGAQWAMAAPLRYLSYSIDTVLLTAALMLATILHQYPFVDTWLTVKVLLLAIYMLMWPVADRLAIRPLRAWLAQRTEMIESPQQIAPWKVHAELTTSDFWRTFASVGVAIPFLFVCGFATVYFLGAKGFCTYGCPYGGFFAPLDKFAPGRSRAITRCG